MRLYFHQNHNLAGGRPIELVTEEVGVGSVSAVDKARKLVDENRSDLVIGAVHAEVAGRMRDVFHKTRTALLVANSGETVVYEGDRSPNIFYNSLNLWRTNQTMGAWAASNLGRKAIIATSYYDSGLRFCVRLSQGIWGSRRRNCPDLCHPCPARRKM